MTPELEAAHACLETAKQASAQTDRAIAQTATSIALAQEAMKACREWQERALAAEAKLKMLQQ